MRLAGCRRSGVTGSVKLLRWVLRGLGMNDGQSRLGVEIR